MKIFLVDGSALLYRSHFAFKGRPLLTSHGELTNAAFGFANALVRLREDEGADAIVVAFDTRQPTFRHEMFPEYKAHRPPMPDELAAQIPRVREVVEAMDIPIVEVDGYEADDVMASLARRGAEDHHEVWIYTGDKDLLPQVRPGIGVLRPGSRGRGDEYLDERAVVERYGLRPAQLRDVLALMGDSSDNVPGIPGVGEKTSQRLIARFGSIDRLLDDLDDPEIPPSLRRKLTAHRDQLLLSRQLVTVDDRVPVELDWSRARVDAPYTPRFIDLCRELEFYSLLERITPREDALTTTRRPRYRAITELRELEEYVARLGSASAAWALDTETTHVDPMRAELVGISFCAAAGDAVFVPVASSAQGQGPASLLGANPQLRLPWPQVRSILAPLLADTTPRKVGQNLKYDQLVLERHGAPVQGVLFDTMIASHLLAPERRQHGLDHLAAEVLGWKTITYKELFEGMPSKDIRDVPLERLAEYACEDADVTLRLFEVFQPRLVDEELDHLMSDVEIPLSQVLLRMEYRGVRLDVDRLEKLSSELRQRLATLTAQVHELAGEAFNLNSPKQLQRILFEKLRLPSVKRTATGHSTDVEVLKRLAQEHPLPARVLEYRQLQKLLSTYAEALPRLVHPETGCLHTSFNQAVAATGRLSSTDPNLQNIPVRTELGRRIRAAFVPREPGWCLLSADYSQIELRLMAHLSGDQTMCESFRRGEDIHARTAALVAGVELTDVSPEMRRAAKAINFGILYGMGPRALAQQIDVPLAEARRFIHDYFERLPGVKRFIDETVECATRDGEVRTLLGRRRRLPELASKSPRQRAFGERIAVNTSIQGSAADLIKLAMIRIDAKLRERALPAWLLLQVHDELILETPRESREEVAALVKGEMENVVDLSVPLVVGISFGNNWAEAHA